MCLSSNNKKIKLTLYFLFFFNIVFKLNAIDKISKNEVLNTYSVNSQYVISLYLNEIKHESIIFSISKYYPYCTWDYVLINLDSTILLKRYDYTSNMIAYRKIEKRKYDNLILRLQWVIETNIYEEEDVDSDGNDTDYGISYWINYHKNGKNYRAVIFNESNSEKYGKVQDEFINAIKGLILEGEICPGLYYK